MKKIVRLTESDLVRLVKRVIKESEFQGTSSKNNFLFEDVNSKFEQLKKMGQNLSQEEKQKTIDCLGNYPNLAKALKGAGYDAMTSYAATFAILSAGAGQGAVAGLAGTLAIFSKAEAHKNYSEIEHKKLIEEAQRFLKCTGTDIAGTILGLFGL